MLLVVLALFVIVPIVEIYVIIQVGQAIGIVPTIALLLADAVLGSLLLRQQGRRAWRRFNSALAARRIPAREVADGLLIAVGATLMLSPGFVTDVFGLFFLIPPTRAVARRFLGAIVGRRFVMVGFGAGGRGGDRPGPGPGGFGADNGSPPPPPRREYDFEGTAEEVDESDPRLPPS